MREVLNHTSIGRAVVGTSSLRNEASPHQPESLMQVDFSGDKSRDRKDLSTNNSDATPVTLFLDPSSANVTMSSERTPLH
jgi:hypothetical protein